MPSVNYKLVYFNLRALGEPIRMLFRYMQVPFQDIRIEPVEWEKVRNNYKWRQLPELHITKQGETYCLTQTIAICRYLSNSYPSYGLMPSQAMDQARCDMIADIVQDMRIRMKPYIVTKYYDPEGSTKLAQIKEQFYDASNLKLVLNNMNEILQETIGNFICGEKVSWADFFLATFTSIWEEVLDDENLLGPYTNLKNHKLAVEALPKIQEWIQEREKTLF